MQAFPGAFGWGAKSIGGRGGQVLHVTNLNDSGAGSFRQALITPGPRIIEFDVSGNIMLGGGDFTEPYCSIAGETALDNGVCIVLDDNEFYIHSTHDWIVRYLRFRNSDPNTTRDIFGVLGARDGLTPSYNVIADHCTFSWGGDEIESNTRNVYNVTIQWCMIYENINPDHRSGSNNANSIYNLSLHHNIYANSSGRNPKVDGKDEIATIPAGEDFRFDVINNVIYNWNDAALILHEAAKVNAIGNYFKLGPNNTRYPTRAEVYYNKSFHFNGGMLFFEGNVGPSEKTGDNWDDGYIRFTDGTLVEKTVPGYSAVPLIQADNPIPIQSADEAYLSVLADAGCSKAQNADGTWRDIRDTADQRVVDGIQDGTGRWINDPAEVGGFPTLTNGGTMPIIPTLEAIEVELRQQAQTLLVQADAIAQAIVDLRAADDALDAAADVIEED